MSARTATVEGGTGGRAGITVLMLVIAAVGMLLLLRARPDPSPFDPRSDADSGTRALVLLLEHQGATVDIVRSVPDEADGRRVLVLQDRLNDEQRSQLLGFADAGGVVVMADPESTLLGPPTRAGSINGGVPVFLVDDIEAQIDVELGDCNVAALQHLRGLFVSEGTRFDDADSTQQCFADGSGAFLVVHSRGEGLVVQLGDNSLFTNGRLRYADNGPLATALLAPSDDARVSVLLGGGAAKSTADIGSGEDTLSDLVRPGVWMALAQLALAFVVFAIAKSIRPGRPVREPEQVPIAGSELVVATGNLMQRAHHAQRAGWMLRGNLYRALCTQFRLPPTISVGALDEAVSARTQVMPGTIAAALEREVQSDAGLIELSNELQKIRDVTLPGHYASQGATP